MTCRFGTSIDNGLDAGDGEYTDMVAAADKATVAATTVVVDGDAAEDDDANNTDVDADNADDVIDAADAADAVDKSMTGRRKRRSSERQ